MMSLRLLDQLMHVVALPYAQGAEIPGSLLLLAFLLEITLAHGGHEHEVVLRDGELDVVALALYHKDAAAETLDQGAVVGADEAVGQRRGVRAAGRCPRGTPAAFARSRTRGGRACPRSRRFPPL